MQRLVDKIVNEFQQNCETIEVSALDGNGGNLLVHQLPLAILFIDLSIFIAFFLSIIDSFQVYQGPIRSLSTFQFSNVLRHPGCFYFFSASAIPTVASPDLEDSVVQRDICWLTGTCDC